MFDSAATATAAAAAATAEAVATATATAVGNVLENSHRRKTCLGRLEFV